MLDYVTEPFLFIVYGLVIRYLVMVIVLMLKLPLPTLPGILGVLTILYYYQLEGAYSDQYFVNVFTMIGCFYLNALNFFQKERY